MNNILCRCYRNWPPSMIKGPIHVRSAGHYIVGPSFRDAQFRKNFFELFWTVSGKGCFIYGGKQYILPPGKIFCYMPGDFHNVASGGNDWEYCWLTLDGDGVEKLLECFDFQRGVHDAGPCPVDLFLTLEEQIVKVDMESVRSALSKAFQILTLAANPGNPGENSLVHRFQELTAMEYGKSSFSVEEAARQLNIHRASLHRMIHKSFGISPIVYIISFRLRKAVDLLQDGYPIKEIAETCGFSNVNYFTKAFRRRFGKAPAEFRNMERKNIRPGTVF